MPAAVQKAPVASPDVVAITSVLRSPEEVGRQRGKGSTLPDDCPTGPWATEAEAKAAIVAWTTSTKSGGGGFGVVWTSKRAAQRAVCSALSCATATRHRRGASGRWRWSRPASAGWCCV